MEKMLNPNRKISIPAGCADYLVREVEGLQRRNEVLAAENNVMHNFFKLVNGLGPRHELGMCSNDQMWQAKKDIEAGKYEAMKNEPQTMPAPPKEFNELANSNRVGSESQIVKCGSEKGQG